MTAVAQERAMDKKAMTKEEAAVELLNVAIATESEKRRMACLVCAKQALRNGLHRRRNKASRIARGIHDHAPEETVPQEDVPASQDVYITPPFLAAVASSDEVLRQEDVVRYVASQMRKRSREVLEGKMVALELEGWADMLEGAPTGWQPKVRKWLAKQNGQTGERSDGQTGPEGGAE